MGRLAPGFYDEQLNATLTAVTAVRVLECSTGQYVYNPAARCKVYQLRRTEPGETTGYGKQLRLELHKIAKSRQRGEWFSNQSSAALRTDMQQTLQFGTERVANGAALHSQRKDSLQLHGSQRIPPYLAAQAIQPLRRCLAWSTANSHSIRLDGGGSYLGAIRLLIVA